MESGILKVKTTLKEARFSATRARILVFTTLASGGPKSVGGLASALSKDIDRATVYRTIELFERLGIVNRIWHGFKHRVELSEIFPPHHHHAMCQQCGRMIDIASPELESALTSLAKKHRFLALNHSVELTGYCPNCQ
jgi:Fur family transcriptional regulator, ferric uptake regulator